MVWIGTFQPLQPPTSLAESVSCPPYDVLSTAEARAMANGRPDSFLHVIRPEIDLPEGADPHDDRAHEQARASLGRLIDTGSLVRAPGRGLWLYRQAWRGRVQAGLVGCVHVRDYEAGRIRRHEKTRARTEDERTHHMLAVGAQTGPILLAYRDREDIDRLATEVMTGAPCFHFDDPGGVTHTAWEIADTGAWVAAFAEVETVYIADGHHRAASAARVARHLTGRGTDPDGRAEHDWFLGVLFPASRMTILPYHRIVRDLNGRDPTSLVQALDALGRVTPAPAPPPNEPGTMGFYAGGGWHHVSLAISEDAANPVESLDAARLQSLVLGPVLGIEDPRTDGRLGFVGGIRGSASLQRLVDAGEAAAAFAMPPTTIEQLLSVADAGLVMPPKSTWFEPKLRSGLFVHELAAP